MASVHSNIPAYERTKIEMPKKTVYNNSLEVGSDLNGTISSTPPSGFFIETLKNRMDVYFKESVDVTNKRSRLYSNITG